MTRPLRAARRRLDQRWRPAFTDDNGFSTVELVIVAPLFVLMLLLIVVLGRVQQAGADVTGAARDAARAASLSRSTLQASVAAQQAVSTALSGLRCAGGPSTSVDTSSFTPGGQVRVSVRCVVSLSDVGFAALPGNATMERSSSSPVETYRAP